MLRVFSTRVEPDKSAEARNAIINAHKLERESIVKEKDELLGSTEEIKKEKEIISEKKQKTEKEFLELWADFKELSDKHKILSLSVSTLDKSFEMKQKSLSEALALSTEKLETVNKEIEQRTKAIEEKEEASNKVLAEQSKEIEDKISEYSSLSKSVASLKEEKLEKQKELDQLNDLLSKTELNIGDKRKLLDSIKDDVDATVGKLNALKNDESVKSDKLISLQHNIDNLSNDIKRAGEDLQDTKMSKASILIREQSINDKKEEILELYRAAGLPTPKL